MHIETIEKALTLTPIVEAHARQRHGHHGRRIRSHIRTKESGGTRLIMVLDD